MRPGAMQTSAAVPDASLRETPDTSRCSLPRNPDIRSPARRRPDASRCCLTRSPDSRTSARCRANTRWCRLSRDPDIRSPARRGPDTSRHCLTRSPDSRTPTRCRANTRRCRVSRDPDIRSSVRRAPDASRRCLTRCPDSRTSGSSVYRGGHQQQGCHRYRADRSANSHPSPSFPSGAVHTGSDAPKTMGAYASQPENVKVKGDIRNRRRVTGRRRPGAGGGLRVAQGPLL